MQIPRHAGVARKSLPLFPTSLGAVLHMSLSGVGAGTYRGLDA